MISVTPEKTNIASNKCNLCVTVIGKFSDPYFEYLLLPMELFVRMCVPPGQVEPAPRASMLQAA